MAGRGDLSPSGARAQPLGGAHGLSLGDAYPVVGGGAWSGFRSEPVMLPGGRLGRAPPEYRILPGIHTPRSRARNAPHGRCTATTNTRALKALPRGLPKSVRWRNWCLASHHRDGGCWTGPWSRARSPLAPARRLWLALGSGVGAHRNVQLACCHEAAGVITCCSCEHMP